MNGEGGGNAPSSLTPAEGGEPVCFLDELDDTGRLLEPVHLIRAAEATEEPSTRLGPELVPLPDEDLEAYRRRLQSPESRTAAWRIALATESGPVTIAVRGPEDHVAALLALLRSLIGT